MIIQEKNTEKLNLLDKQIIKINKELRSMKNIIDLMEYNKNKDDKSNHDNK